MTPNCSYCSLNWNYTTQNYYSACQSCVYGFVYNYDNRNCLSCKAAIPYCQSCGMTQFWATVTSGN